jgi:hypothetical protein
MRQNMGIMETVMLKQTIGMMDRMRLVKMNEG